jgi:TPR repeat protein
VKQDFAQAARLFRPPAEEGHPRAQNNLGALYDQGLGVEQNDEQAARWFRSAAEQGHPTAQFNLSQLLRKGLGVEQDFVAAYAWATLAADSGNQGGMILRTGMNEVMTREDIDKAKKLAKELRQKVRVTKDEGKAPRG